MKTIISHETLETKAISKESWECKIQNLAELFEERIEDHDGRDCFVEQNYDDLKAAGFFSACIPVELGGGGVTHSEMANLLRLLGQYCSSTALASSMHQHLVTTNVWKWINQKAGEPMLRKVAQEQPILVSTGARDWLESNGEVKKVEGGYRVSALKHFASQSAYGEILVTSAPYEDPTEGWCVLHFPVPFTSKGLTIIPNWKALGMRGTGSNTVKLDDVFVPENAIVLKRSRVGFHPLYNVITAIAMPYIMGAYVGIAQKAAKIAINCARNQSNPKSHLVSSIGQMKNVLTNAELCWKDMVRIANDLDFQPSDSVGQDILTRKTLVSKSCIETVELAMEVVGGQGFFRNYGLEKLFRDVQAAKYHPLPEKDQFIFSGESILKKQ